MTEEIKFNVLLSLFTWIQKSKTSSQKRSKFRKFLDTYCNPRDYFAAIRLILPSLDRERGTYGLKESVLATCLIDALGISRDSPDAVRLINWRKGGAAKNGANAGNFPNVAADVLQSRQGMASGGLTIKELNELLDRLASSENRSEKISVLSTLIQKTNAHEMKWIIMIILKDLKIGMSEKSIFHEFHPDAEDLFNVTCDLKLVCEKLRDRSQRHKRQDIDVGKAVRPQLAMRVGDASAAWKKLHGKEVVVECKFDGDRIQIHKNGTEVHYFSRNFLDHSEYSHAMSDLIVQNVLVDKCILDGEMLVWDTSLNRFAEFGSNQEIAKAAREGLDSHRQLCYVAFDILYVGDTSVIHQSLRERHELLRKVVKPLKGRVEVLVPNGGLNTHRLPGEPCWSTMAHHVDDVERFFKETVENRDEGIVLKDLGSKWEPGDRSGKWLKLKPEYVRTGADLDVLIIGGYYGSGRRGGEVAQFLVGLAESSGTNTYPTRFISFCRVGTGLSDEELDAVVTKLKPYFRKYDYPKKAPPSFYHVTNHSKERPDVWIESPEKSIILSITSDIRTIRSEVFAAPYSLRFPRIDRVKYDKPWHECLDVQSFVELVRSSNGTTQKQKEPENIEDKPKPVKSSRRGERKTLSVVPSHFIHTDISNIEGKTTIFSDMMFYFVNVPASHSLNTLHQIVVENGGKFSMNLNNSVTHCIAVESSGLKYQAAKLRQDIIHYSWVLDCCSQKKLLPLQPKYFLHLSESSKRKLQDEIDEFSDSYFWDLDLEGLKQLLSNVDKSEGAKTVKNYKKKFCPKEKWSCLDGCCIYLHPYMRLLKIPEWEALSGITSRRLMLEVLMAGGKVSKSLAHATHFVVLSLPEDNVDFEYLAKSVSEIEKHLLFKKRLHVVKSHWLEDSLERELRLPEHMYSLRPSVMEESDSEEFKSNQDAEEIVPSSSMRKESPGSAARKGKQRVSEIALEDSVLATSPKRDGKKKRGRPAAKTVKRGKSVVNQTRTMRARRGKMPSKLAEDETEEESGFSGEKANDDEIELAETSNGKEKKGRPAAKTGKRGNSGVNQTQTTRAHRDKMPSKIAGDETEEESSFSGEKANDDEIEMAETSNALHREANSENATTRDSNLQRSERIEHKVAQDTQPGKSVDKAPKVDATEKLYTKDNNKPQASDTNKIDEILHGQDNDQPEDRKDTETGGSEYGQDSNKLEKVEIMIDPVQAMLMDMIPSLGVKKAEGTNSTIENKRHSSICNTGPVEKRKHNAENENPCIEETTIEPVKKRKVSYKDVASELLKDF